MTISKKLSRDAGSSKRWKAIAIGALIVLACAVVGVRVVIARAEPLLRDRVIEALSSRFQGKVELGSFSVSVINGIQVSGEGLKVYGPTDPNPYEPGVQPLIAVQEFRFQTPVRSLFRSPMHVETIYVKGLELNIPPKQDRGEMKKITSKTRRLAIIVDNFVCEDTKLLINTSAASKPPWEMAISNLKMKEIGTGQPLQFTATLVNPKPVGDIQTRGLFGPWQPESPRDTPVQGNYSFSNADLSTIKGIAGILSSTGEYSGMLGNIVVHGTTDTPDFRLASSGHPVPLHTEFHAVVDGTTGDTYLRPVNASFLQSSLVANGSVVRMKPKGHDIELNVDIEKAQIDDLLRLGVHTDPPVMNGAVQMKTRLSLVPGDASVADRLKLAGTFHIPEAHFTSENVQHKIDSLSLRSQGKPKQAKEAAEQDVSTDLRGDFKLNNGVLSFSLLHFLIPGTHIDMAGDYGLDGKTLDFHGTARLEAKVSQMTTGWKSILLKPLDPLFSKHGVGTEVPIKVTGTESDIHIGLDYGHKSEHGPERKQVDRASMQ